MFDFCPFFVLRLALENGVDHTFYKISSFPQPRLKKKKLERVWSYKGHLYLLLVFADSPEPLPMLP
jgi:hypothetical protein